MNEGNSLIKLIKCVLQLAIKSGSIQYLQQKPILLSLNSIKLMPEVPHLSCFTFLTWPFLLPSAAYLAFTSHPDASQASTQKHLRAGQHIAEHATTKYILDFDDKGN